MRDTIIFAAASLGLAFLGIPIRPVFPTAALLILCTAGLLFALALYSLTKSLLRRVDPYDLCKLRDLHEYGETPKQEEEAPDFDSVYCPSCHTVYSVEFPICPNCSCSRPLGSG